MHTFLILASLAVLAPHLVHAGIKITSPNGDTTCTGDEPCTITWEDDGLPPSPADLSPCNIELDWTKFIGVDRLEDDVDVADTSSFEFKVNPAVGPNGDEYYIQIDCPYSNYQAYSAPFSLTGMTGSLDQ